jgi:hypothetical protein
MDPFCNLTIGHDILDIGSRQAVDHRSGKRQYLGDMPSLGQPTAFEVPNVPDVRTSVCRQRFVWKLVH